MENKRNNFKGYQSERVANRLVIIQEQIALYKKKKVKFRNITEMSQALAEHITKQEGSSCSTSTILRNDTYKSLIEEYVYSQEGVKKPGEAVNLLAELTLSNVERENHRLKQYITSLEKELDELKNKAGKTDVIVKTKETYLTDDEDKVAKLTKTLNLLIQHFEGLVAINENGDLIDLTKKVNNVIVNRKALY